VSVTPSDNRLARLLIVDDDPGTIRLLAKMLQGFGEIFFATSGEAAISMIAEKHPDIVLLDAEMPGLNGFETCVAIKVDLNYDDLPILFVTAYTDVDSEIRALNAGAVDFITKPLSAPIVQARVRTHLALKERTDQLRRLASTDGLTGVANRRAFDAALKVEWRRALRSRRHMSLLLIDVDHFKLFNDRYGHLAGDDCLRRVAAVLAASSQRPGDLLARYGGEEFVALLPDNTLGQAERLADLMRSRVLDLEIPNEGSATKSKLTISIGIGTIDGSNCTLDLASARAQDGAILVEAADLALYQAKGNGRNAQVGRTVEWLQALPPGSASEAPT
jgi:diguanylate cyclase (GGDEF)-like protein